MKVSTRAGRVLAIIAAAGALAAGLAVQAQPQTKEEPLVFDVASIKPTPADERRGIIHQLPGNQTYEAIGVPLRVIMTVAYTVTDRQISGGPDWINTDRWSIMAKADRRGTNDELHAALARLIEDRFQLRLKHDTREMQAYVLTVDRKGLKMPVHDPADLQHEPIGGRFQNGELNLAGQNVMMDYFAFFLSRGLPLNVVNQTGLTDHYDVQFHYVPDIPAGRGGDGGGAPPPPPADGPDIFTALREQLGLRLEKGKAQVESLVIEHVEKPTAN